MDALDLTKAPPRPPRTKLAGLDLLMAARSVDKFRATLPGGKLGDYAITGFTMRMLETLGLGEEEFRDAVARAANDIEIADWLREVCSPSQFAEVNRIIAARLVRDRIGDADFRKRYPHAVSLPLDMPIVDMLPIDDELVFAKG
ncbi:MAG TPA: DUF5069 domain-containing protein [Candidatus Baltobacteraceae bacterium]|nr:DUF5069 domain-containing protein [Candidatus Baltobacteraceae bacterium]